MSSNTDTDVTNRSEIAFFYDAVDANPNGNPLSAGNRPRIDPETEQAVVTDVRLKRYLRDQLEADGHGVYIRDVTTDDGTQAQREELLADRLRELDPGEWDLGSLSDDAEDELREAVFGAFLENSADVRYFGATLSVDMQGAYEGFEEYLPDHFTGPVQFSPGKTIHPVRENEEYDSLTSVIATGEGKEQGGFGLDDHRIQYGFIRFQGVVDEHGASDTSLTEGDVRRLDTLCWRSIKNQTLSRSKVGQEPRLYLRVEYADESYHLGDVARSFTLDESESAPVDELRTIRDVTLDASDAVGRLENAADRIDTVHVVGSDLLSVTVDGDTGGVSLLYDALRDAVGDEAVRVIDVYDEYPATVADQ